ncbi:MAG: DMT family transporter [Hyphomicrobiales bacterium]
MIEPQTRTADTSRSWLVLAPGLFVLLWSTGFIGARLGMPYAEPFAFLALRFGLVAGLVTILALAMKAKWPSRRDVLHAFIVGCLIHGGYLGGVFWAIDQGMPAGVSALIVGLQPLLTALLAGAFLGEEVRARHWLGLGIGIAGVAMVFAPKLNLVGSGIDFATVTASVFATLSITIGSIYQKKFATGTDLTTGAVWQYVGATLTMLAVALITRETFTFNWTGELIFALVWLAIVLSLGAISLYMLMIRHGQVSRISAVFFLVPGVTAIIAWLMFGETLTIVQIAGMVVCGFAVALAGRNS